MALKQATIQVSPHISVTGTMMTMAMMIDPPAEGMTKVLCNGQVFEGKMLGKPWLVEDSFKVTQSGADWPA